MPEPKRISILGSTGSIGVSALKLARDYPEKFQVVGLSAGKNLRLLAEQIVAFKPARVSIQHAADRKTLQSLLPAATEVSIGVGDEGIEAIATAPETELVVSSLVGAAGIKPTYAAICAGKDIALANKETIVSAGPVIMAAVKKHRINMLPVDSEHSAILQALGDRAHRSLCQKAGTAEAPHRDVKRLILTASGGPFRNHTLEMLAQVTPQSALRHPTWNMGAKITIDSATLMNKGLEVIEATRLFETPAEKVDVVVHPQSIIHSMVEYVDGSILAQLGVTDMRGPLAFAMAFPEKLTGALPSPDFATIGGLTFEKPDLQRFPCLKLAYDAAAGADSLSTVLNAANEVCVAAFLQNKIGFMEIPRLIAATMEKHDAQPLTSLDDVLSIDAWAREVTLQNATTRHGHATIVAENI